MAKRQIIMMVEIEGTEANKTSIIEAFEDGVSRLRDTKHYNDYHLSLWDDYQMTKRWSGSNLITLSIRVEEIYPEGENV